jgi:hypothetical protein
MESNRARDEHIGCYPIPGVVASAVIPTLIANAFFLPRHLLPRHDVEAPST